MLIGSSGAGQTFTKEVVEAMSSFNEVIVPKSLLGCIDNYNILEGIMVCKQVFL